MANLTLLVPTANELACSLGDVLVRYAQSLKYGVSCKSDEYLEAALNISTILILCDSECDDVNEYIENLYNTCVKPTLANLTPTDTDKPDCSSFLVEVIDPDPVDCSSFSISVDDLCVSNSGTAKTKPFNLVLIADVP